MTTGQLLSTGWHWEPGVVSGCALLAGLYLGLARPLTGRALVFLAGLLVLLLSLVSPLALLAEVYLFSAHMLQHMLLVLVVPPLLLLGLPPPAARSALARTPLGRTERLLAHPAPAWGLFNAGLWLWHLPALYDAALRQPGLHVVEHLIFLATATLFWWPVIAPAAGLVERPRLAPWAALLYLGAALVAGTVLGILLTFAPPDLYPSYRQPDDRLGLVPLLRDGWGLGPAADQQLGGLLMWIPGGLIYSLAMLVIFAHWFSQPDDLEDEPVPSRPAAEPS